VPARVGNPAAVPYVRAHMVTARLRVLLALPVVGGALLLSGCGNATDQAADARASTVAPTSSAFPTPVPVPSTPRSVPTGTAAKRPGPPGIPMGTGRTITVDGIIEGGVEPGCKVLTSGSTMYLVLGGKDVPLGVPVRVEGILQPGVLSTCQQGTPLRVTSVKRR
jgi:hypothetical protein